MQTDTRIVIKFRTKEYLINKEALIYVLKRLGAKEIKKEEEILEFMEKYKLFSQSFLKTMSSL